MNLQIQDPWFEGIYRVEFNSNPIKFLDTFKELLRERHYREKKIITLLTEYSNGEISVGKIAQKLDIDRTEVWKLMEKYNIDLVDYDFAEEDDRGF
ncbi:MAG: UPF0175 family protein, partial [Sulfurovum sp.]